MRTYTEMQTPETENALVTVQMKQFLQNVVPGGQMGLPVVVEQHLSQQLQD